MTQDKPAEWAMKAAEDVALSWFPEAHHDFQILAQDIALALSQAYERGQVDMRERAAVAASSLPVQIYRDKGIGPAGRSCKPATIDDAVEAIRSLPIDGKDA